MSDLIGRFMLYLVLTFVAGILWWVTAKQAFRARRRANLLRRHGFNYDLDLSNWKFGATLCSVVVLGALLLGIRYLCSPAFMGIGLILVIVGSMLNFLGLLVSDVGRPAIEKVPSGKFTGHLLWNEPDGCRFLDQATPEVVAELVDGKGYILYISGHEVIRDQEVGEVPGQGKVILDFTVVGDADNKDFPTSCDALVTWVCQLFTDAITNATVPDGFFQDGELECLLRKTGNAAHQAKDRPQGVQFAVTVSIPQPDREIYRDRVPK